MFRESAVTLLDFMGDDKRVCDAARVSLLNDRQDEELSDKDVKLIKFLLREKHTSPFEHCTATFRIVAPLPVVAQIMRHRTFSYNQASRRYTAEDIEFFEMGPWRAQGTKNLQCSTGELDSGDSQVLAELYKAHCRKSFALYQLFLEQGVAREQARFILPQGLMAQFYMTGSLHNFLKFLILRDEEHAQPECREIAIEIRKLLSDAFPEVMRLWEESRTPVVEASK